MLLRQALLNWVTPSQSGLLWNMPRIIAPEHTLMNWIRISSCWLACVCPSSLAASLWCYVCVRLRAVLGCMLTANWQNVFYPNSDSVFGSCPSKILPNDYNRLTLESLTSHASLSDANMAFKWLEAVFMRACLHVLWLPDVKMAAVEQGCNLLEPNKEML